MDELARTDCITAKPEIMRKAKSIARHHVGAALQQECEQACAMNIKGVATQCIIHRKLAAAPIVSDLMGSDSTAIKFEARS